MREKLNWWWWFLITAIALPLIQYLLTGQYIIPVLKSVHHLFVVGPNSLSSLFILLPFFVLTIFFKLIARIIKSSNTYTTVYSITGILIIIALVIDSLAVRNINLDSGSPGHHYTIEDHNTAGTIAPYTFGYLTVFRILVLAVFFIFFIINFKRIQSEKK